MDDDLPPFAPILPPPFATVSSPSRYNDVNMGRWLPGSLDRPAFCRWHPAKLCPTLAAILGADTFLPPPAAVLVHPPAGPKPERDEMDVLLVIAAAALGLYCVGNPPVPRIFAEDGCQVGARLS